jgi:ABC-2 type transport system ATP-binding protein
MARMAIQAQGLTKRYEERAVVDGIDLAIPYGEVFGLLGPNGAGKTTTILMLLGLTESSAGKIRVAGVDPARDALTVRSTVGYLPDAVGFYDDLTGRQNLRYTARLNRLAKGEIESRIDGLLHEVGLTDAADGAVGTYSRGMKQRLGIADALVKDPTIVILDEPTAAIDPEGASQIQRLIRALADERSITVLVSSHLLHQMQQVCDRVAIFVNGSIVAQGRPDELATAIGEGRTTLELETEAAGPAVEQALAPLGAGDITSTGLGRWRLSVPAERSAEVASALAGAGVAVLQLRRIGDDLDEVYRRYFESKEVSDVGTAR